MSPLLEKKRNLIFILFLIIISALFVFIDSSNFHLTNGHTDRISSVEWNSDGKLLATSSKDASIKIWDTNTGKLIQTLSQHTKWVNDASWSPNGRFLASASDDKSVKIWETSNWSIKFDFREHSDFVSDIDWNENGLLASSGGPDDSRIIIWNITNGKQVTTLNGHEKGITKIDWHPNNTLLASTDYNNNLFIWNVSDGTIIRKIKVQDTSFLDWHPNGEELVYSNGINSFSIINLKTNLTTVIDKLNVGYIHSIQWDNDGKRLAIAGSYKIISIINIQTNQTNLRLTGHLGIIWSVDWHPIDDIIVSGSSDLTSRVWDINRGKELMLLGKPQLRIFELRIREWGQVIAGLLALIPFITLIKYYRETKINEFLLFALVFLSVSLNQFFIPIANITNELLPLQLLYSFYFLVIFLLNIHAMRLLWSKPPQIIEYAFFIWYGIIQILLMVNISWILFFDYDIYIDSHALSSQGIIITELYSLFVAFLLLFSYHRIKPINPTENILIGHNLWKLVTIIFLLYNLLLFIVNFLNIGILFNLLPLFLLLIIIIIAYISIFLPETMLLSECQIIRNLQLYELVEKEREELETKDTLTFNLGEYLKNIPPGIPAIDNYLKRSKQSKD